MRPRVLRVAVIALALACVPRATLAQTGSIVGTVTDSSGAVLPGVTVEASSPALIERVRTTATDSRGLYTITDLRPGVYKVTFTLSGFNVVAHDAIELSAAFTATVNAQLSIGAVEETLTVSAAAPLVDVRNTQQNTVMTKTLVESLPTAKTVMNFGVLIPGANVNSAGAAASGGQAQDVGGSSANRNIRLSIHGSNPEDFQQLYDGMRAQSLNGSDAQSQLGVNTGSVEEISIQTGNMSAESSFSGVRANVVPKQGGNDFSGYFQGAYSNHNLQAKNFGNQTGTDKVWDINPSIGGPIKSGKVWFFGSFRYWGDDDLPANFYHAADPLAFKFVPGEPGIVPNWLRSANGRLTWQVAPKHKLALFVDSQRRCTCAYNGAATLQFEATPQYSIKPGELYQATWNWTVSDRVFIENGISRYNVAFHFDPQPDVLPTTYQAIELSTGVAFRAPGTLANLNGSSTSTKTNLTYVTGAHTFKVGLQTLWGTRDESRNVNNDTVLQLLQGLPNSVVQYATPLQDVQQLKMAGGLFAQELWTLSSRLTLSLGARFDYLNAYVPASFHPAVQYVGARSFDQVNDVPNWKDFSPRVGATWDVFGTARTAVKASVGRYVEGITTTLATIADPTNATVISATRQWGDTNGDFIPQASELGPLSNSSFGQSNVTTRLDPQLSSGFRKRIYNWETNLGIQHEFTPGLSASALYVHRWFGNFRVTQNLATTPANYDPYCVAAPSDSRLPDGGGNRICGLYDVNPIVFGKVNNLVTLSDNLGEQSQQFDGLDLFGTVRRSGVTVQAGVSYGRTKTDTCYVVNSPGELRFCGIDPPMQPNVKLFGVYPIPWQQFVVSATFQSVPGPQILANQVVRSADIAPSLGRPLSAGPTATVSIPLIQPGTQFGDRMNQLDVRLTRRFVVDRLRIEPQIDLYNVLNANPVLSFNTTYGSAWLTPTYVLPGRLLKLGIQVSF